MIVKNKILILTLILTFSLFLSGCTLSFKTDSSTSVANDGGVYRSINDGNTWVQKTLIPTTTGKPRTFAMLGIYSMAIDPSDEKAIYAGSVDNGLFYSYDSGNDWFPVSGLDKVTISAIAVDPKNKCNIYAAVANKVIVSRDCSRTWTPIYFDNDLKEYVTSIAVDYYNNNNVYIGISRGEIIKSSDQGVSWKTMNRFKNDVVKIVISPNDSRVVFVGTKTEGVFRSNDEGNHWDDLSPNFKHLDSSPSFQDLALSKSEPGTVFLATKYGILKSTDNGSTWNKINLITPEKDATINSLLVSSTDAKKIYYVTNTTFYRSVDGGQNWTTKKLPTTKAGWRLLMEPKDKGMIYMGVRDVKK